MVRLLRSLLMREILNVGLFMEDLLCDELHILLELLLLFVGDVGGWRSEGGKVTIG